MTIGPDLTDDNGRLRPEVARAIQNVPDGPLPLAPEVEWPEAVGALAPAAPAAAQPAAVPRAPADIPAPVPRRPVAPRFVPPVPNVPPVQPFEIRIPVPRVFTAPVPFGMALICAGVAVVLALNAGARFGNRLGDRPSVLESIVAQQRQDATASTTPGESTPTGVISGINVNLRAGPGLGYAVVTKLMDRQPVEIREQRDGWVSIATNSGTSGWVFGAYVSGTGSTTQMPAVVRRLMVSGAGSSRVLLRPGDRVLHQRSDDGRSVALLADGRRMAVEEGGLVDVR